MGEAKIGECFPYTSNLREREKSPETTLKFKYLEGLIIPI